MVQILPKQYHFGEELGKQLGTGLSGALDTLANIKLQDVIKRQQAATERNVLSQTSSGIYSPEEINFLSNFPRGSKEQLSAMQMLAEHRQPQSSDIGTQMLSDMTGQPSQPMNAQQLMAGQSNVPQPGIRSALASGIQTPQMKQAERHFSAKMKVQHYTATEKTRNTITKAKQNADEDIARLNKLEKLSDAGKLPNDMVYKFLDEIGMSDVGSLVGADAQEFNKIITDFTSKAKDRYGARISNFELGTFLRGLPSLLQTPEGRKQVIKDLKLFAQLPQRRFDLMQQLKKENDGIPPLDLEDQIESRMEPFKKEIFSKYEQYGEDLPQYNVISRSKTQPKASESKGETVKFPNGKFYHSDGMRWRPAEIKGNQVSFLPEEELM